MRENSLFRERQEQKPSKAPKGTEAKDTESSPHVVSSVFGDQQA